MLNPAQRKGEVPAGVGLGVVGQDRLDPADAVIGEEPEGTLDERGARRAAFVVVDLRVGQAAVGIDRRVHVAHPAASALGADRDCRPPVHTPPTAIRDPPELLHIHMHKLPGLLVWIRRITRPVGRSIHARRLSPNRHNTRCTVEGAIPSLAAIRTGPIFSRGEAAQPQPRPRAACDADSHADGSGGPQARPHPPAANRSHHFHAVARETPISSATCATGRPPSDPADHRQPALHRQPRVSVHHRASWSWDLDSSTPPGGSRHQPTVNNLGGQYS